MTTIVYCHAENAVAYDSRTTQQGEILSDNIEKSHTVGDKKFFMSGSVDDCKEFAETFREGIIANKMYDCDGIMFDGKDFFMVLVDEDKMFRKSVLNYNYAIGSGSKYAISALDFGCTAIEAVRYASSKDCYTGGKIRATENAKVKKIRI